MELWAGAAKAPALGMGGQCVPFWPLLPLHQLGMEPVVAGKAQVLWDSMGRSRGGDWSHGSVGGAQWCLQAWVTTVEHCTGHSGLGSLLQHQQPSAPRAGTASEPAQLSPCCPMLLAHSSPSPPELPGAPPYSASASLQCYCVHLAPWTGSSSGACARGAACSQGGT